MSCAKKSVFTLMILSAAGCKPPTMDQDTIAYAKQYVRFQNVRASAKTDYRGSSLGTLHMDVANTGSRDDPRHLAGDLRRTLAVRPN